MSALGFTLAVLISVVVIVAVFVSGFFLGIFALRSLARDATGKSFEELVKANRKSEEGKAK
jgi:hypothetical protein